MHHSRKQRHRHEYELKDYIRRKMKGGTGFYPHKVGGTKKRNGGKKYRKTMNRRR